MKDQGTCRQSSAAILAVLMTMAASSSWSQEVTIVTPTDYATNDGDSFGSGVGPGSMQWFIPAEEFAALPETHRTIIGYATRMNSGQPVPPDTPTVVQTWPNFSILLSTKNNGELSSRFKDNTGPDVTTVFKGRLATKFSTTFTPDGPREFAETMRFDKPFSYDPSQGDLLVEFRAPTAAFPSVWVDGYLSDEPRSTFFGRLENSSIIAQFVFGPTGDFSLSGWLDVDDVDLLAAEIRTPSGIAAYDLNRDGLTDTADLDIWVHDLMGTYFGDADLNGEFDSSDLVSILASGTYEIDVDSSWSTGDFDADGRTNTADLVAALADGGYEQGQRPVTAVPEPSSFLIMALGSLVWIRGRRANLAFRRAFGGSVSVLR